MTTGRLKAAVYVQDPSTREELILLPGEVPEPEVAVLITNPDAWDQTPGEEDEPEPVAVGEPDPTGRDSGPETSGGEAGGAKKPQARRSRSSGS